MKDKQKPRQGSEFHRLAGGPKIVKTRPENCKLLSLGFMMFHVDFVSFDLDHCVAQHQSS